MLTKPGANSGLYFHTAFQAAGWPNQGFEVQINNTHRGEGNYRELKKTGSLYGVRNQYKSIVQDNEWFKVHIIDYVFTDAMTFTDDAGKRTRLWIKEEVAIQNKQAFMDRLVDRIVAILSHEPVDIYVNPTFLPECIAQEYDALWTKERMQKVIEAAARSGVAIEINARYRIPSQAFINRVLSAKNCAKLFARIAGGERLFLE